MGLGWGHKKNLMLVLKNHRRKFLSSFEYSSDRIFKSKEGGGRAQLFQGILFFTAWISYVLQKGGIGYMYDKDSKSWFSFLKFALKPQSWVVIWTSSPIEYLWSPWRSSSKSWQLQSGLLDEKVFVFGRTITRGITFGRESETVRFRWDWHGTKGFGGQGHERACLSWTGLFMMVIGMVDLLDVHRWTGRSHQDWFGSRWLLAVDFDPWVIEDSLQVDSVTGWDG